MTFRELFWAHLVHRDTLVMAVLLSLFLVIFSTPWVVSWPFGAPMWPWLVSVALIVFVLTSSPLLFAIAKINPALPKRDQRFLLEAHWPLILLHWLMGFLATSIFICVYTSDIWHVFSVAVGCLAGLTVAVFSRRKLKREGIGGDPKSHFRGHEHHSSKIVR